jgi:hypothetical protein
VDNQGRSQQWRERAAALRNLAQIAKDAVIRQHLVQTAETWEKLATNADNRPQDGG